MSDLNLGEEHFYDPDDTAEAEMAGEMKAMNRCIARMFRGDINECECAYHEGATPEDIRKNIDHLYKTHPGLREMVESDLPPGWTRNDDGVGNPVCPRCSKGDHEHHRYGGVLYDCKELPPVEFWLTFEDEPRPLCPYQCCCKEHEVRG